MDRRTETITMHVKFMYTLVWISNHYQSYRLSFIFRRFYHGIKEGNIDMWTQTNDKANVTFSLLKPKPVLLHASATAVTVVAPIHTATVSHYHHYRHHFHYPDHRSHICRDTNRHHISQNSHATSARIWLDREINSKQFDVFSLARFVGGGAPFLRESGPNKNKSTP